MDREALKAIGEKVVAANNDGSYKTLIDTVYDPSCVSVESGPVPGGSAEAQGLEAIAGKWAWWEDNHTVHETTAKGPFLHGDDRFGVIFAVDCTFKPTGERTQMQELAIYTVKDGKIVREEFFN
ncbi:MAG: nuclear transport factor 2 family protein [Henriciella sp.]|uniref:nuclear transport factor 2 family protein n=1 Tax=Henriciella sp. TaxID=1968823 RepID=UPI002605CC3D|nr:nuclear transport factor 2 family protein [Henriciella sp.]